MTIKTGLSVADPAAMITVTAFDKNNIVVPGGAAIGEQNADGIPLPDTDYVATGTARNFVVTVDPNIVEGTLVTKVVVSVATLTTNDLTAVDAKGAVVKTKLASYTRVITVGPAPAANVDRPNVVSIQRLRPGSQSVVSAFEEASVTGAFDVKIVFTELPFEFALAKITVDGGTASNLVVGVPFTRLANAAGEEDSTFRPHPVEGGYEHDGLGALVGVPGAVASDATVTLTLSLYPLAMIKCIISTV